VPINGGLLQNAREDPSRFDAWQVLLKKGQINRGCLERIEKQF